MDRKKDMEQYIEEYRAERIRLKKMNLEAIRAKLQPLFKEKLKQLAADQLRKRRGSPEKAEALYLCRLLSSGYTESYESVLGLGGSLLFLDKRRSETYWCPEYLYKDLESDMEEVKKRLKKKFIRIEEYELLYLKQRLLEDDWEILEACFLELVSSAAPVLRESGLKTGAELKVMSGSYMEQLKLQGSLAVWPAGDKESVGGTEQAEVTKG